MLPIIALKNIISTVNFQSALPLLIAFVANSNGTFSRGVCSQCSLSSSVSYALELRYFVAASIFTCLSSVSCWWCCPHWQLVQSDVLSTRSFLLLSSPSLLMLHFKSRAAPRDIFINRKKYGAIPSLQATIRPCAIPALHTCVEIINLLLWDATLLCKELSHEGILHIESQQGEWNWPWKCHVQVVQVDNYCFIKMSTKHW